MPGKIVDRQTLLKEIEIFENEIELRKQGKLDEKVFAETRLRRGVYGQRYDNGQRHDGKKTQQLAYPSGDLLKGPNTVWDAPGMQRIKVPFGGLTPEQLETVAELAEEFSDSVAHVTTRQDFQLHYVHIDHTPEIMRRLAEVGITTREACGNSVRNVTACPLAGICRDETFDVTPYAKACSQFLLGHPDAQDFGRKFKIAFSGCKHHACGLTSMHDLGAIARTQTIDGREQRGFELYMGGGLGAVPHSAKLFDKFVPEEELLPLTQAVARVFARLGEKKNRARARIKFLVQNMGIDEFRKVVLEERENLTDDRRWRDFIQKNSREEEKPSSAPSTLNNKLSSGFEKWYRDNVYRQRQPGYAAVTIRLPLGDISAYQMRKLTDLARQYIDGTIRLTVEQNILLRWVSEADLPSLYRDLKKIHLSSAGAGTIEDITVCPGTDTCKLGIASSRGLAAELQNRFASGFLLESGDLDNGNQEVADIIRQLRIKISGCFNSCGQHHIADLGFYGVNRKIDSHMVPHFQVVLGGQWQENAGSYGLAIGAVPSKRIPTVVKRIATKYAQERLQDENFQAFTRRIGKTEIKKALQDLTEVPAYEEKRDFYSDWGDPREFTLGDMGVGECAGEVVTKVEFELSASERKIFEAQLALEKGESSAAGHQAYLAMIRAARALVMTYVTDVPENPEIVIDEFRRRFYDTALFFDPFARGKFAEYFFKAHEYSKKDYTEELAHQRIEEALLFVEAAHSCYNRMHNSTN